MIIDTDFPDHWKTEIAVGILGECAVRCLLRLFAHCQIRKTDRFKITDDALKYICKFNGNSADLIKGFVDSGFISRDGEWLTVKKFREYNGTLFANWKNGPKGGRPKKVRETPEKPSSVSCSLSTSENPTKTQWKPNDNPIITSGETQPKPINKINKIKPPNPQKGELNLKDDFKEKLGKLFGRRPTTQWSDKEIRAFNKLFPFQPEDFELIQWFYQLPTAEDARKYRRKDLATLLNNWSGELDRAQSFRNGPGRNLNSRLATTTAENSEKRFNSPLDAEDEKLLEEKKKAYESSEDFLRDVALECKAIYTKHPSGISGKTRFKLESLNQEQRQKLLAIANGASEKINRYYESLAK